jgi:hypothetical protein
MRIRIVDAALAIATIAGAIIAVNSASKLHALQQEHTRLSRTTGDLIISDPGQVHVLALDTGEPLHFAWRVYAPAGHMMIAESSDGGSSTSTGFNTRPHEFIGRVRFSKQRNGRISVYHNFGSGAGLRSFGSAETFEFLSQHWNELDIEQLGADATAHVKPGDSVTVLRIRLPENLAAEASKRSTDGSSGRLDPDIYGLRLELNP